LGQEEKGADMARDVVAEIRRATRRKFKAEDKIRIVLEGLRGEISVSQLCRRESISPALYYQWSKAFLEAGKNGLTVDTKRDATKVEVQRLREENEALKKAVAECVLETQRLKKSLGM
jgi:transposase